MKVSEENKGVALPGGAASQSPKASFPARGQESGRERAGFAGKTRLGDRVRATAHASYSRDRICPGLWVFETLTFVHLLLNFPPEVQAHLRHRLEQYWEQVRKQEGIFPRHHLASQSRFFRVELIVASEPGNTLTSLPFLIPLNDDTDVMLPSSKL